jgi:hypothetical protein
MGVTSNRELARQLGVSETAVRRAEKAGRIRREPDGAWDLAKVKVAWVRNTDRSQQRRQHGAMKPVPKAALGAVRDTLRENGESVSAGGMTFIQARTANEVLKAQERRVRLQRMKGELVDRAKAVAQVFRLARNERDAWVNWPARVAAMIAAELEVDPHQLHAVLVLSGALELPGFAEEPAGSLAVKWIPPKWDWVDPLKDRKAEIEAIEAGLKSRSDVIESEGYDAEEVDRRIAADHAREEELGLTFGQPATAGAEPVVEVDPEGRERPIQSEEQAA